MVLLSISLKSTGKGGELVLVLTESVSWFDSLFRSTINFSTPSKPVVFLLCKNRASVIDPSANNIAKMG